MVKIIERGWAGHFICADRCLFRRNTLIEGKTDSVIVSTVGNMKSVDTIGMDTVGAGRYYETMVFGIKHDGPYIDINVSDQRRFDAPWAINADSDDDLPDDVDNLANAMHEKVVKKFAERLKGE